MLPHFNLKAFTTKITELTERYRGKDYYLAGINDPLISFGKPLLHPKKSLCSLCSLW